MNPKTSLKQRFIFWLAHRIPPCKTIARLASESNERHLTLGERVKIRLHLLICSWCQRYMGQLGSIRQAASRMNPASVQQAHENDGVRRMPADARDRLKNRLKEALEEKR